MGQVLTNLSDLLDLGNDAEGQDIDNVGTLTAEAFVGDASGLTGIATDAAITTVAQALAVHAARTDNPHAVTKSQIGLGSVSNALQLIAANNLSDLVSAATARTNLGLGTAATQASSAFEAAITAGTTSQYRRGDKSWQTLNAAAIPDFATAVGAYAPASPTPTLASVLAAGSTDGGTGATFDGTTGGNHVVLSLNFGRSVSLYSEDGGTEGGVKASSVLNLVGGAYTSIRSGTSTLNVIGNGSGTGTSLSPNGGAFIALSAAGQPVVIGATTTARSDATVDVASPIYCRDDLTVTGVINASGYKVSGVSGVTGTFAVPTSITVSGGIITAIS